MPPMAASTAVPPGMVGGPVGYKPPTRGFNGIFILGEAPGREEAFEKIPFAGQAGRLADRILEKAGYSRDQLWMANVFRWRPDNNDHTLFFGEAPKGSAAPAPAGQAAPENPNDVVTDTTHIPAYNPGKGKTLYIKRAFLPDIRFLRASIMAIQPAVIMPMGNIACWAMIGMTGIGKMRGMIFSVPWTDAAIIPTYHPASALPSRSPDNEKAILVDLTGPVRHALDAAGYRGIDPDNFDHPATGYCGKIDQGEYNAFIKKLEQAQKERQSKAA